MSKMLEGHAALVAGAGRGIGRAVAVMLAREGCDVALVARNAAELDETKALCESHGGRAIARGICGQDGKSIRTVGDPSSDSTGNLSGGCGFASLTVYDLQLGYANASVYLSSYFGTITWASYTIQWQRNCRVWPLLNRPSRRVAKIVDVE
jgi:NAD(P)-dependent dehydrogenase (short-subunit alcohol dehydrogenase family)